MRQSYLKNAALITGADIVLRLAGMGLRIWLANALGGEGMGLYQLVLAVYSLFVTLATSGVSVAATRLMAEELSRSRAEARGMLVRLLGAALLLGSAALAAQFGLAGLAAKWWLGDVRATGALRVSAFGMPWMAVSAVLRGFFIARRRVSPNVVSQLAEQTVRIGAIWFALSRGAALDVGGKCTAVLAATALSEAVSCGMMALFYRQEAVSAFGAGPARRPADPAKRLWEILWPVEGGRCLASALHTAENMLVARVPDGISAGRRGPQRRRGPIRQFERHGPAAADLSLRAARELIRSADAGDHPSPHPGREKAAFGFAGPDAAADGLLLCAGGGGVLGVGRPAGRPSVRRKRGRGGLLSDSPRPGHAADVP